MSSLPNPALETIRIGERVELDVSARHLYCSGQRVKLERIPMEILLLLVERRGTVVSRREIVDRVWGASVSFDSDNSINGAIRKIRQALKDDPDDPRFIETVTGSGYRCLAPVRTDEVELSSEPVHHRTLSELRTVAPPRSGSRLVLPLLMGLVVVTAAAWLWASKSPADPRRDRIMLAVLPFENLTGNAEQDYFSEGLTEEMIVRIGNLDARRLGVIARASVARYRRAESDLRRLVRDLGVHYAIRGSVRRDGDRVRITAQLIQLSNETHLWSKNYDRELGDLIAVQDEIAKAVADEIEVTFGGRAGAREPAGRTLSTERFEAFDLYLKGRYFWNKRTPAGLEQAARYFHQAIDRDSDYARAYAGLAEAYALMSGYTGRPSDEFIPRAREAARRAVALDPSLPEAHTSLAVIAQNHDWDWHGAERAYRRAIELDPNYATAHHWYAEFLGFQGRFDEALIEIDRARRLDPLSLIINTDYVAILYFSGQPDRAREVLREVLEMDPSFPRARNFRVWLSTHYGRFQDALAELDTWPDGFWRAALRCYVHARAGQRTDALHAFERLQQLYREQRMDGAPMVVAMVGLGQLDDAFTWLFRGIGERSPELAAIKVHPLYDPLRGDPRFDDVLERMRLTRKPSQ